MTKKEIILTTLAAILGGLRMSGHTSIAYQAVAHCFVGAMLMGWIIEQNKDDRACYKFLTIALSVLEVTCALYFRVIAPHFGL